MKTITVKVERNNTINYFNVNVCYPVNKLKFYENIGEVDFNGKKVPAILSKDTINLIETKSEVKCIAENKIINGKAYMKLTAYYFVN